MDNYAAIILGVFFLVGIILHHWLRTGHASNIKKWIKAPLLTLPLNWMLFAASSIGYIAFTTFLLASHGDDKESGLLFLFNVSVLIIGGALAIIKKVTLSKVLGTAALIQSVILTIMLIQGYGDAWFVAVINSSIIAGFGLLSWLNNIGDKANA